MLMREYSLRFGEDIPETVLYAGEYLEHNGELFGVTFGTGDAISKAAEMFCIFLDDDHFEEMNGYRRT